MGKNKTSSKPQTRSKWQFIAIILTMCGAEHRCVRSSQTAVLSVVDWSQSSSARRETADRTTSATLRCAPYTESGGSVMICIVIDLVKAPAIIPTTVHTSRDVWLMDSTTETRNCGEGFIAAQVDYLDCDPQSRSGSVGLMHGRATGNRSSTKHCRCRNSVPSPRLDGTCPIEEPLHHDD